jgi:hypothetical protein
MTYLGLSLAKSPSGSESDEFEHLSARASAPECSESILLGEEARNLPCWPTRLPGSSRFSDEIKQLARSGDASHRALEAPELDRDRLSERDSLAFAYRGPGAFGPRGSSGHSRRAGVSDGPR